MLDSHCRKIKGLALAAMVLVAATAGAFAAPDADCNGQLNIRYLSGAPFGLNGDQYVVEVGLGTGTITGGAANTLSLSSVRFNLDCTFSGLPGCTDDGNVIAFVDDITTTCGTTWLASFPDGNTVDFTSSSPVVIPANQPAFPGFCQLRFTIQIANSNDARDDSTPSRVEEIVRYSIATCDNGLPSTGSQSSALELCQVCNDNSVCTTDSCNHDTNACTFAPNAPCDDSNACTTDTCDPVLGCVFTPNAPCNDSNACTTDTCNPVTGCVFTPNPPCNDSNACTTDTCNPVTGCVFTPNPPCNDFNACTTDTCNPVTGCVFTPNAPCNDSNACTTDTCDPAIGCVFTPNAPCNDFNACTTDTCNPVTGCVFTPNAPCNDSNACTTDTCDPVLGCVFTPNAPCNDSNACTTDICNPVTGCVFTPNAPCNDSNACTTDTCNPVTGCVFTPNAPCNDSNACTTDICNPVTGCVYTPNAPCDDGDVCTDDVCDPVQGCVFTPNDECNEICRTPGFWGTHADRDAGKPCSQDITAAVINLAPDHALHICGECITNDANGETLPPKNAGSAVEAMCVRVKGQPARQLARQLTAAALNCLVSENPADCSGSSIADIFALCNAGCAVSAGTAPGPAPAGYDLGGCIAAIDCFNNGLGQPSGDGTCGGSTGCHDRALPLDLIFPGGTKCGGRLGPAGSNDECSAANESNCTVIPPGESQCTNGDPSCQ